MAAELKLVVNDNPIATDYFVKEFTEHTVAGMMGGLRDTGEVKDLHLTINEGVVEININGRQIPVNEFASLIITSTIEGMLKPMKGVTFPVRRVHIEIRR